MEVVIQPHAAAATEFVAEIIADEMRIRSRPVLGLATGRTMESVYARLVRMREAGALDFSACRTFNLDEYVGLPPDHPNSYRHYMNQHLFGKINIELRNTHVPDGMAADLEAECAEYERRIVKAGGIDLQLLGIGNSGHIGFNEPLSAFRSRTRVVTLAPATLQQNGPIFGGTDRMPRRAITMGVRTILESRRCILLATGPDKAEVAAQAIEGPLTSMIPASALQLHSHCVFVLDEAAAACLGKAEYYRSLYENDPQWDRFRRSLSGAGERETAPPNREAGAAWREAGAPGPFRRE